MSTAETNRRAEAFAREFAAKPSAFDLAAREVAALRAENAALRERAPPLPPDLRGMRPGQPVTDQELAALSRAQVAGTLRTTPGRLHAVTVHDAGGRPVHHFFTGPADEGVAWRPFETGHSRRGTIRREVR